MPASLCTNFRKHYDSQKISTVLSTDDHTPELLDKLLACRDIDVSAQCKGLHPPIAIGLKRAHSAPHLAGHYLNTAVKLMNHETCVPQESLSISSSVKKNVEIAVKKAETLDKQDKQAQLARKMRENLDEIEKTRSWASKNSWRPA